MQILISRLNEVEKEVKAISKKLDNQSIESRNALLTTREVIDMLDVSRRTLQNYRDNGVIDFVKIGRKIYYREVDIEKMIAEHLTQGHISINNLKMRNNEKRGKIRNY